MFQSASNAHYIVFSSIANTRAFVYCFDGKKAEKTEPIFSAFFKPYFTRVAR